MRKGDANSRCVDARWVSSFAASLRCDAVCGTVQYAMHWYVVVGVAGMEHSKAAKQLLYFGDRSIQRQNILPL